MEKLSEFLDFQIFHVGDYSIKVHSIISAVIIFFVTKFIIWLIKKAMFGKKRLDLFDQKNISGLFQIVKYLIWVVSIALILNTFDVKVTVLLAGSAALLVGIGMGLQQTFNDFISGIILLIEGSTKVGDVLEIDGEVIKIEEIGLRTSKGLSRNDIVMIIPNHLITTNKVINWSHQIKKTRFKIEIGVAYGSDVDVIYKILKDSVLENKDIIDRDSIEPRFVNFGNSSIDFEVLFFSNNVFTIEKTKSDIRKVIYKNLAKNNITIPFPQMDVYLKK
ncbi:MAG: mechanosensitive ion channel protein MscS [Bacteroidetes bacterium]|nr:MAG: mechanosensitive ion channel protein MscS [Bacteroidota bacterium]